MTLKRIVATFAITAGMIGATATAATAGRPDCPPGQTSTVSLVGTEVVKTCRVL